MSIKLVKKAIKNPKTGTVAYYAQQAPVDAMSLKEVIATIEKQSTVSSSDIKAVLDALENVIITALKNGRSVRLGDLGSFRTTVKSNGVAKAEEVTVSNVTAVRVNFSKSATMMNEFDVKQVSLAFQ